MLFPPPAAVHPHPAPSNRHGHGEAFRDRPSRAKPFSSHLLQHHKLYPGHALSRSSSPELGHSSRSGPGSPCWFLLGRAPSFILSGIPTPACSLAFSPWRSQARRGGQFLHQPPHLLDSSLWVFTPSFQQSTHLSLRATRAPRVHLFSSRAALGRRDSGWAGSGSGVTGSSLRTLPLALYLQSL